MTLDPPNERPLPSSSPEERVEYFRRKKLAHRNLARAWDKLLVAVMDPDPCSLTLVYGPTGGGKTTLAHRLKDYLESLDGKILRSPGTIPVALIEAVASGNSGFDWRDYYIRALQALDEPLIHKKLDPDFMLHTARAYQTHLRSKRPSVTDLRRGLESCLRQRCPRAFLIDEVQHLKKIASGKRLIDQMDTIKSLANMTGVKHVLFGTYELFGLTNLSAQLNRRTVEIHFPRYRFDDPKDMEEFILFLESLEKHLPMPEPSLLSENPLAVRFIYTRSAGCPGILKDWMTRALGEAIREGSKKVDISHYERTAIPDVQLARIAREIKEGENQINPDRSEEIESLLGVASTDRGGPFQQASVKSPEKRSRNPRPGTRKPSRDPIGLGGAEIPLEKSDDRPITRPESA